MRITGLPLSTSRSYFLLNTTQFDTGSAVRNPSSAPWPRHLRQRGECFYFVRKIPAAVADAFGKVRGQIWRSLHTPNFETAVVALAKEVLEFDGIVSSQAQFASPAAARSMLVRRRGQGTTKYLLHAHIPALLERHAYAELSADDAVRKGLCKPERDRRLKELETQRTELLDRVAEEDDVDVKEAARAILAEERLIAPPNCGAMDEFVIQLAGTRIEVLGVKCDRLRGLIRRTPVARPACPRDMPTMLTLFERWSEGRTNRRTMETYRGYVAEFESVSGALPVSSICATHVDSLRDHLVRQGLSKATILNYLGGLATLLRHGQKSRVVALGENVFDNVNTEAIPKRPASEIRRGFEVSELSVLFNSPVYVDGMRPRGQVAEAAFWAPLLAIFAGPRIEEVAQVRLEDIQRVNGTWVLRISDQDPEQGLKNAPSFRLVPLHDELIRCGFLAYAAKLKLGGHQRLFPSLSNANKNRVYSNALGKWFSKYLDSIGLADDRLSFHSLRYSFKRRCLESDVGEITSDALAGHWMTKSRKSGRRYFGNRIGQLPLVALTSGIRKLRYEELDLSHLHVALPMEGVEEAFASVDATALPVEVRRKRGRRVQRSSKALS